MTLSTDMAPERLIILLAGRLTFSETEIQMLRQACEKDLEWYLVFRMALKNKILPLVWHNLSELHLIQSVPARLQKVIKFYCLGTAERNKVFMTEMTKVMAAMTAENIMCVPVKGAYLIPNVYKDHAIRTVNDVDCLIRHADAVSIRNLMNSLGYTEGEYDQKSKSIIPFKRARSILWTTRLNNLMPFVKLSGSQYAEFVAFDFSFSLDFSRFTEAVDLMVERSAVSGNIRRLKPCDFFIHQCCHHYKEATNVSWVNIGSDLNLIKFCDVREYVKKDMKESDLVEMIQAAKEFNVEKAVYFVLYYLNLIYEDGYETQYMQMLGIEDDDFLNKFGQYDYGYELTWQRDFWDRLFLDDNAVEIKVQPKYSDILGDSQLS